MKIIDRYILKKFLSTYIFVVLILVAVIVMIDLTEKNDDFIQHNLSLEPILKYYLAFIPFVANLITPITVFIATVFVTAKMAGQTEIIAILSSGISFRRLMVPYFIGAIIIAAVSFYFNGWVIPDSNKYRVAFEVEYVKKPFYFDERNIHIKVAPTSYLYMEHYNNQANVGYRFTLETIENNELKEKLTAKRIEWQEDSARWRIKEWKLRTFDGFEETVTFGNEMDTVLKILPKDFGNTYRQNEAMTIDELNDHIEELRGRGSVEAEIYVIEKYIRYMMPFTVLILTFIGLTVSSRKARGGAGFQIALGFLIAFIFIIAYIMSRSIAQAGTMNPLLAVWLPNIIFTIVGFVMYKTVPR